MIFRAFEITRTRHIGLTAMLKNAFDVQERVNNHRTHFRLWRFALGRFR